jgi:hypothetical protein
MKLRALVVLGIAAFTFAACSKCGGGGSTSGTASGVERVMPKGAVGVVVVPSLEQLGQKLKLVQGFKVVSFVGQLRGFNDGQQLGDALVNELGIDVRSTEALAKAGIDGARSAGVGALITGHGYLALPVKNEKDFHAAIEGLAKRRLGTTLTGEKKFGDVTVKTFSVKEGDEPKLAYAFAFGYGLVTDGAGLPKLAMVASLTDSDALSSDTVYLAELAKLPKERDLFAYFPTGSPALMRGPMSSAIASLALTPTEFNVVINGNAKPDGMDLGVLQPQPAATDLLGYLPRDAFLVTRYSGDPTKLAPVLNEVLGPFLTRAFSEAQFKLDEQVLAQLQPGVVAALSLSERPPMDKGMPQLDLRQTNPFTYFHLSGAAAAKSKDVALPALEQIAAIAPKFGANMEVRSRADGQKAVITTYAQGEGVHFAPKDELVFFASPIQRLDALVKSDGKGGSPVTPLGDDALAVSIDLSKLSASVRALPESAWGLGGFAIKATTVRWLDATDDLKGISVWVGAKDRRVEARVKLTLGGAKPAP